MLIPRRADVRLLLAAAAVLPILGALFLLWEDALPHEEITQIRHIGNNGSPSPREKAEFHDQPAEIVPGEFPTHADEISRIRATVTATGPLKRGQIRNEEVIILLRRLAEIDPAGAIAFALENEKIHGDPELPGELFTIWLGRLDTAAQRWFSTLPAGDLRSRVAPSVISSLSVQDPKRALEILVSLQGEFRRRSIEGLFAGWSEQDPHAAATYALQMKAVKERDLALAAVAETWSQSSLTEAVAWLSSLSWGGEREAALRGLLLEWATTEPAQAAAFGKTIPANSTVRGEWLRALAAQWTAQDADAALRWAQGLATEHERGVALRIAVTELAKEGNASAAERMLALPPGEARQQALELILNRWTAADLNAAAQWSVKLPPSQLPDVLRALGPAWARREPQSLAPLLTQVLDKQLKDTLVSAVAEGWAIQQPAAAAHWAMTQLPETERRQAVRHLVPAWADRDLSGVGTWINGLGAGPARDLSVEVLSDYLTAKHPEEAAEWAKSIADNKNRQMQMEQVFVSWSGKDPAAARRWFGETFEVQGKARK